MVEIPGILCNETHHQPTQHAPSRTTKSVKRRRRKYDRALPYALCTSTTTVVIQINQKNTRAHTHSHTKGVRVLLRSPWTKHTPGHGTHTSGSTYLIQKKQQQYISKVPLLDNISCFIGRTTRKARGIRADKPRRRLLHDPGEICSLGIGQEKRERGGTAALGSGRRGAMSVVEAR